METAREIEKSARQKHREEREARKQEMEAQVRELDLCTRLPLIIDALMDYRYCSTNRLRWLRVDGGARRGGGARGGGRRPRGGRRGRGAPRLRAVPRAGAQAARAHPVSAHCIKLILLFLSYYSYRFESA